MAAEAGGGLGPRAFLDTAVGAGELDRCCCGGGGGGKPLKTPLLRELFGVPGFAIAELFFTP